jgi:hypothetical protein
MIPWEQGTKNVFSGVGVYVTRTGTFPRETTRKFDTVSAERDNQD